MPEVSNISNEEGFYSIKGILSSQHDRDYSIPNIEVVGSNLSEDRKLILKYNPYNNRELNYINKSKILKHLENLWGFEVIIQ
jgi:stage V sporulation protein R